MASNRDRRQQEIRFKVMRLLQKDPSMSTREIAQEVRISNGAAYYCVTALIEKGFVKLKNFSKSTNNTNYFYELTPRGIQAKAAMTIKFLERKRDEYDQLRAEIGHLENELELNKKGVRDDENGWV